MESIARRGALYHRTKLMEAQRAEAFARALAANGRFEAVTVEESKTAKSDRRFYVQYQPQADARYRAMVAAEQAKREERAAAESGKYLFVLDDGGRYFHCLNVVSGEVYETTEHGCSCPDAHYRGAALGACKHVRILRGPAPQIRGWNA